MTFKLNLCIILKDGGLISMEHFSTFLNIFVEKGTSFVVLIVFFIVMNNIVLNRISKYWKLYVTKKQLSEQRAFTVYKLFMSLLQYTLYFVTIYGFLSILGVPVSTLLAGAGFAGLIIGLGAQGFIHDCVSGLFILIEKQFDVNDHVRIGQMEGIVKSIGLRITTLTALDGTLIFIRNRDISIVNNLSLGKRRVLVNIFIKSTENLDNILQVIDNVTDATYLDYPEILQKPDIIGLQTTQNGQLYISVGLYVKSEDTIRLQHIFYNAYIQALGQHGISVI